MTQDQPLRKSATRPAWTVGEIFWLVITLGLAYPWIWLRRRRRTVVTRHYR